MEHLVIVQEPTGEYVIRYGIPRQTVRLAPGSTEHAELDRFLRGVLPDYGE